MSEEVIVTGEFCKNAKHLYRTALRYVKANYACMGKQSFETSDEVVRIFRLLHKALTRFNYGVDPLAEGGAKEWYHITPRLLEIIRDRLERMPKKGQNNEH